MYIPQVMPPQVWAAGQPLRVSLETLVLQSGGAPLHLVEWILLIHAKISNPGGNAFPGYELARIVDSAQFIPNQSCDASILSGHAMQAIDWAMTGRRAWEPEDLSAGGADEWRKIALRLPFHGSLIGGKSKKYKDLISPVFRWKQGQIVLSCSAADPFSEATGVINEATITPIAVTEPIPTEYVEAAALVYGETIDSTGATTTQYPSDGRTMYMGLHPLDRDAGPVIYPSVTVKDICALSNITPNQMACVWNAMECLGDEGDEALNLDIPQFLPIVHSRPGDCPQWTLPKLGTGNVNLTLTGTTATEHRICWAQLRESPAARAELGAKLGVNIPGPSVNVSDKANQGDVLKAVAVADTLPVEVPIYPAANIK